MYLCDKSLTRHISCNEQDERMSEVKRRASLSGIDDDDWHHCRRRLGRADDRMAGVLLSVRGDLCGVILLADWTDTIRDDTEEKIGEAED